MNRGTVNIAPSSTGFKVFSRFEAAEYALTIEGAELRATGPAAPTEELRILVERNREALKAAVLLSDTPSWLAKLFDLCWSGHETPAQATVMEVEEHYNGEQTKLATQVCELAHSSNEIRNGGGRRIVRSIAVGGGGLDGR